MLLAKIQIIQLEVPFSPLSSDSKSSKPV